MANMFHNADLERLAARLGAEAGDRVDAEGTAWAVLARLRREGAHVPWWRRRFVIPAVATAAAVALVVGIVQPFGGRSAQEKFDIPMAASLDNLAADELSQLLDSLAYEAPVYEFVPAGLPDLSENELEVLLQSMEG